MTARQVAERILDELDAATWATYREDRVRIVAAHVARVDAEAACARDTGYDPERREIARRAAGGL